MKKQLLFIFLALAIVPFSTSHCSENEKKPRPEIVALGLLIIGALGYSVYRYIHYTKPSEITDNPAQGQKDNGDKLLYTAITTENKKHTEALTNKNSNDSKTTIIPDKHTDKHYSKENLQKSHSDQIDKSTQHTKNTPHTAAELHANKLAEAIVDTQKYTPEKKAQQQSQSTPILNNSNPHYSLKEELFQIAHNSLRKIRFGENSWD